MKTKPAAGQTEEQALNAVKNVEAQRSEQLSVYDKAETIFAEVEAKPVNSEGKPDSASRLMEVTFPDKVRRIALGRGVENTLGTYSVAKVVARRDMSGEIAGRKFNIEKGQVALRLFQS